MPVRRSDIPTPGHYLLKLIRGGPWVGAVVLHKPEGWYVCVNGEWLGASPDPWPADWPAFSAAMERVHFGGRTEINGRPVSEDDIRFLDAKRQWAALYAPDDKAANPRRAIDLDKIVPF